MALNINGISTTDASVICNELNNHFCTVGSKLASSINSDENVFKFNTLPSMNSAMFLRPASIQEVIPLINKLDCGKAPGPDNITAVTLKTHHSAFARILTDVFNEIIQTGLYPDQLKVARVVPIFKSGDRKDLNNYRPISILSVLNKILEQLIATRIRNFLDLSGVLYSGQYGFRRGSSTQTATSELLDDVYSDLDNQRYTGALFLDLKKAFDVINHKLLLKKLECYGIRGNAHKLLESYLTNRLQSTNANGSKSYPRVIDSGVPQGSVLGPLLFIIFVNDLSRLKLRGKVRLFADDTAITYSHPDAEQITQYIQADLGTLNQYFTSNLLFLNLAKTVYMMFHSTKRPVPDLPAILINNEKIQRVTNFKYLGLVLDDVLSWSSHIEQLKKKNAALCGILRKISAFVPSRWLKTLYCSMIHSRLQYLVVNWGNACKSKLRELQTLQNRSLKIVLKKPALYSTRSLYAGCNHSFLPIKALHMFQTCVQMHNMIRNPSTHHNLSLVRMEHERVTRQTGNLKLARPSTEFGKKRISYNGCYLYNNLPNSIKNSSSLTSFKSKLKLHCKQNIGQYLV